MKVGRRSSLGLVLALVSVLGLGARCGDEDKPKAAASTSTSTAVGLTGNLTVLAAASLSEAFRELGGAFEGKHPATKITFSFDASSALALQANNGAPADLFASADQANMKKVTDAGNATGSRVVARNKLAIVVAKGNPKKVSGLADLGKSSVTYVLCAPEVPCGKYGAEALRKAGVKAKPKSLETNVKAVVTKVSGGEVDAGIGYVTDARAAAPSAEGIEIPDEYNVVAEYPMAVLKQSTRTELASAFLEFVLTPDGQAVLAKYGFTAV
ncbi:MAG TPA: molybdate ABC transporter substrate-binding protein [Acidimicrobiia bacterium]|nr:molybdate ABC transporter substrate-binding protein [Acidimicrobiia bacterium]